MGAKGEGYNLVISRITIRLRGNKCIYVARKLRVGWTGFFLHATSVHNIIVT